MSEDPVHDVRVAYSNMNGYPGTRDLDFHTEPLDIETAVAAIEYIGKYGHFDPEITEKKLRLVDAEEWSGVEIVVARESSPAIYIETSMPDLTKTVFLDYPDIIESHDAAINKAMKRGDIREPSEGKTWVRLWWD